MELYDSEEQQVEAIKDWWQENGKAVIIGAVVGLGGLFGWRYYQDTQLTAKDTASENYTNIMTTLSSQGAKAETEIQAFIDGHSKSEYSVLAAMQLAKAQLDAGEQQKALTQLQWAQANTKDDALKPLITFRIARLKAALADFDGAVAELSTIKDTAWTGRTDELRGDILLQKGDKEGAYSAYTEAQQAADASQTLQLKLDDLAK